MTLYRPSRERNSNIAQILAVLWPTLFAGQLAWAEDVGPALSATEIKQMIIGNIVWRVMPDGRTFGGIYNQDGTFVYGNSSTGTWRIDGENFCATEHGQAEVCGTFHKLSEKKFEFIRTDGSKSFVVNVK
jgi:hypothetical protein